MQYHLAFIVFNIWYLSINAQSGNDSTVHPVVQNSTVVATTFVPTTEHVKVDHTTAVPDVTTVTTVAPHTTTVTTAASHTTTVTTVVSSVNTVTTVPSTMATVTIVSNKGFVPSYVEPAPHPLGYCTRSRLRCSPIRRCCQGPCDVNNMRCP